MESRKIHQQIHRQTIKSHQNLSNPITCHRKPQSSLKKTEKMAMHCLSRPPAACLGARRLMALLWPDRALLSVPWMAKGEDLPSETMWISSKDILM